LSALSRSILLVVLEEENEKGRERRVARGKGGGEERRKGNSTSQSIYSLPFHHALTAERKNLRRRIAQKGEKEGDSLKASFLCPLFDAAGGEEAKKKEKRKGRKKKKGGRSAPTPPSYFSWRATSAGKGNPKTVIRRKGGGKVGKEKLPPKYCPISLR